MTDHHHVGGSKNSNINNKRDDTQKPRRNKGYRKQTPKFENSKGEPIE